MGKVPQIVLIGFGEAAKAFTKGWLTEQLQNIKAFDSKTLELDTRQSKLDDYVKYQVSGHDSLEEAIEDADLIFSLVTANQSTIAAFSIAQHIRAKTYFFDCNSCSPQTKKINAAKIEQAGGYYIDTAIMSPVQPNLHRTPIFISGIMAQQALTKLMLLNMNASIISSEVGGASLIKMLRSIMIKGLEALNAECLLAARKAGIEKMLFESLSSVFPNFEEKSTYMLERMLQHGERRAAEMKEVALTLEALELPNSLTIATAQWQQKVGEIQLPVAKHEFCIFADEILQGLKK